MKNTKFTKKQNLNAYPNGIQNHYWNLCRSMIISDILDRNIARNAVIYDIGCGRGVEISYLRNRGWNCSGCDTSAGTAISENIKKYIQYKTSSFSLNTKRVKEIDTLLFLDVLEHIDNPTEFIKKHLKKYANCKNIIITLPARQELWTNYDKFYKHYCRYSLKSAELIFNSIPVLYIKSGYFFHSLYIPAIILKLLKKPRSITICKPNKKYIWLNKFMALIFFLEYKIVPSRIWGTSLYSHITLK
jgi:SAM-dependent methyltransferase